MTRDWSVAHSLKGNWVCLYEYDWRARAWNAVDGKVCGCRLPDWFWRIPLGKPKRDEDGLLGNSVGSAILSVEQWVGRRTWQAADRCKVATLDISQEQLLDLVPDWAFLFEDDAA